jgi:hypothetical protein
MTNFEDQLRESLQPGDVPPGFANRVLARLPEGYPPQRSLPVLRRVAIWAAALVICVGGVTGLEISKTREERVQGEKARQELMLALRITGTKLNQAQSRVRQIATDDGAKGERP